MRLCPYSKVLILLLAGGVIAAGSLYARRSAERELANEIALAASAAVVPPQQEITSEIVISEGSNFGDLLRQADLESALIAELTEAATPVFNFRRLREGNRMTIIRSSTGHLESICYSIDPDHELWIARNGEAYRAEVREVPSTISVEAIAGEIHGSLFDSVMEVGERPELALRLAEIFAWDLDFYTDPRPGDTFRVVMEKRRYDNEQLPSYGRILMAEYENDGHAYRAVLFHDHEGRPAYYSAEGKSLQKAFLRSPLKFVARISSHFSRRRFHPVLKIYRPHLGTDYAAPAGTPVQAIAAGRVIFSGRQGGGGNVVQIRHANGYVSYYLHLLRRSVRVGQSVRQGQHIGLVGATGVATGAHLDFRVRRNGTFVNFERMNLPPSYPVPRTEWAAFVEARDRWMPMLSTAVVANRTPVRGTQGAVAGSD